MAHRSRILSAIQRELYYRKIVPVLLKYGWEEFADVVAAHLGRRTRWIFRRLGVTQARLERSPAERLRLTLEELGPTFIKLGQILSMRPDLVPLDYILELEKLQDRVPPEDFEDIRIQVESQLGNTLENLFQSFDRKPIAAGSIAQTHRAVLRDGREAAVKVRRPGIERRLPIECEVIKGMAHLLEKHLGPNPDVHPTRIASEFANAVMKEADLATERRYQGMFLRNFQDDPTVHIPEVYLEYCTKGVLTMEFIHGVKPTHRRELEKAGLDGSVAARRAAHFIMTQIFQQNVFHADPHAGNLFVMPDNVICIIDFGQVGRLSHRNREVLTTVIVAMASGNIERMVHTFERAGMLSPRTDKESLIEDGEIVYEEYYAVPEGAFPLSEVMHRNIELIRQHDILAPPEFTLILKSLITAEALVKDLDPEFKIVPYLREYGERMRLEMVAPPRLAKKLWKLLRRSGELLFSLPDDLSVIIKRFRQGSIGFEITIKRLDEIMSVAHKTTNRLSLALVIAALLIGSSMLVTRPETALYVVDIQNLGVIGFIIAGVLGLLLVYSILRGR